jgi:uncharacterized repeat protein (TIGR01451 family)
MWNSKENLSEGKKPRAIITRAGGAGLCALCWALAASGQATSAAIRIKTIAEVENKAMEGDHEVVRLAPADRVVPGDEVLYTVAARNTGPIAVAAPIVTNPIPAHMVYVADSATGPGAEVSYSIDGGHTFDRPENLRVLGPDGQWHPAKAVDYTHIRWQLKNTLKSNSVAFARFRAVVK